MLRRREGKFRVELIIGLVLFSWAFGINLWLAGRGFMPMDQSVVFDGGWRTICGQIPFRDYTGMTGLVPSLLQALFFQLLGVTWFAYCFHASVFNGLFCVMAYGLLRGFKVERGVAIAGGFLSGLAFYPPSGTPYMEQHAFFFLLAAAFLLVAGGRAKSIAARRLLWAAAPYCMLLAFLSKQNAACITAPAVLLAGLCVARGAEERKELATWLAAGTTLCLITVAAALILFGMSPDKIWTDMFQQSIDTGRVRLTSLVWTKIAESWAARPFKVLAGGVLSGFFLLQTVRTLRGARSKRVAFELLFALSLLLLPVAFSLTTMNQMVGGIPYCFIALAIFHHHRSIVAPGPKTNTALRLFLLLFTAGLAYRFSVHDALRSFHDQEFDSRTAQLMTIPELRFLRFQVPRQLEGFHAADLDRIVRYLRARPGNFFLLGDSSILYGLSGKPSTNPQLYFHSGMRRSFFIHSRKDSYEEELLANLRRYQVDLIVIEGKRTWTGVTLDTFPKLREWIRQRAFHTTSLGWFRGIELSSRPGLK